jgi:hypothetical protein
MLNGEFTQEQSEALAQRLQREHPNDLRGQVARAIRLTTTRVPEAREIDQDVEFVRSLQKSGSLTDSEALRHYCLLALNTNEFIYLD